MFAALALIGALLAATSAAEGDALHFSDVATRALGRAATLAPHEVAADSVRLLFPVGGEVVRTGDLATLRWQGGLPGGRVHLYLYRNGLSGPFEKIVDRIPDTGSYDWLVTGPPTQLAFVAIEIENDFGFVSDESPAPFQIVVPPGARPTVHFDAPNRADTLLVGQPLDLSWTAVDPAGLTSTTLVIAYGDTTSPIVLLEGVPFSGIYRWTVAPPTYPTVYFGARARNIVGGTSTDWSDASFVLATPLESGFVPFFSVTTDRDAIVIRWRLARDDLEGETRLERNLAPTTAWSALAAPVEMRGDTHVVIDRDVVPGQRYRYHVLLTRAVPAVLTPEPAVVAPPRIDQIAIWTITPNPVRDQTRIVFALPGPMTVRMKLLDLQGREIALLDERARGWGKTDLWWRVADSSPPLHPGVYFLAVEGGGQRSVKRIVVLSR